LSTNYIKNPVLNSQNIASSNFDTSYYDDVLVSDEKEGDQAEQLIVQKLRNREIVQINDYFDGEDYKVNWVSSTSKRFEGNLNWDEKLGYDVELSSKSGKHLFIEIKSYWYDEISFYFSTNELKVAKEKGREYRLIFVGNRKEESPTIHILPIEFIQNAEDGGNESFSFEISQYRCKKN
ncbi:MAG: protein NO VEIN domain-containing protein, partial [Treponema sp.]